jgi:hypothetical protein
MILDTQRDEECECRAAMDCDGAARAVLRVGSPDLLRK